MQTVSRAYKEAQTKQTRAQMYMDVTIGVINQAAQNNSAVDPVHRVLEYPEASGQLRAGIHVRHL